MMKISLFFRVFRKFSSPAANPKTGRALGGWLTGGQLSSRRFLRVSSAARFGIAQKPGES
jgi:hypothetical protein